MKTKLKVLTALLSGAIVLGTGTAIGINAASKKNVIDTPVRTVALDKKEVDYDSYFKSFRNSKITMEEGITTFTGEKQLKDYDLSFLDLVAEKVTEEEKNQYVNYDVKFSDDNSKVIITATINNGNTTQVEELVGFVFENENGETDAIINLEDGSTILMSELENKYVDNCKWLSKLIKGVVSTVVAAIVVAVVPITISAVVAVTAAAAATYGAISVAEKAKAEKNYDNNKKLAQPTSYVNGQKSYSKWKFGASTFDKNGCGVIAAYNVLRGIGKTKSLADVCYEFDYNSGTLASGLFGADPSHYQKFFSKNNINCKKYTTYSSLQSAAKSMKTNQMILLCSWNGNTIFNGAHYVAVSYNPKNTKPFTIYNRYSNSSYSYSYSTLDSSVMGGSLITSFIVG